MVRSCSVLVAVALGGVLAACGGATPDSPFPASPGPTPVQLAPQTMVLQRAQLPQYVRTSDSTVDANILADQESDQTLVGTLMRQGLQVGARAQFSDPNNGQPTPFATVISQVLIFNDAQGASSFFTDEKARRSKPPDGGTLAPLANLPSGGADAVIGLAATVPADASGDGPTRALFAMVRRGRIVAELLGGGSAQTATDAQFTTLVGDQEQQLRATLAS